MGIVFTEWIDEGTNYDTYKTILTRFWDEEFDNYDDPLGQIEATYRWHLGRFQDALESGDLEIRRGIPYICNGAAKYFENLGIDVHRLQLFPENIPTAYASTF
jgi:hypothetical protein